VSEVSEEGGCDAMLKGDAWVAVDGGMVEDTGGGGAAVEVAVGRLAPTPRDSTGAEVGPDPTPRRGAEDPPSGLTPTDNRGAVVGPDPTPRSVPVGSMPTDRRGAEVGPTPTPIRGPEVGAIPTERRGSDVGPTCTPNRAPPSADDDLELPPRTGERRPLAMLPTPPRRPLSVDGTELYGFMSQALEHFRNSLTVGTGAAAGVAAGASPLPRIPPNNPPSGVATADAVDDGASLPPPRSPPSNPSLRERKSLPLRLSTLSPVTPFRQILSLIPSNYKRKSRLRRRGRGSCPVSQNRN
jgi:hypothetical protein